MVIDIYAFLLDYKIKGSVNIVKTMQENTNLAEYQDYNSKAK